MHTIRIRMCSLEDDATPEWDSIYGSFRLVAEQQNEPVAELYLQQTPTSLRLQRWCVPPQHESMGTTLLSIAMRQAEQSGTMLIEATPDYAPGLSPGEPRPLRYAGQLLPQHFIDEGVSCYRLMPSSIAPDNEREYRLLQHGTPFRDDGSWLVLRGTLEHLPHHEAYRPHRERHQINSGQVWQSTETWVSIGESLLVNSSEKADHPRSFRPFSLALYNDFVLAHVVTSLHELGWFDWVDVDPQKTWRLDDSARELNTDARILDGMLTFMEGAGFIARFGNEYRVHATQLAQLKQDLHFLTYMVSGYGPVLAKTRALARGELRYFEDIRRHEPGVAHFAPAVKATVGAAIAKTLDLVSFRKIAHLGCGSAQRLIAFCQQDPELLAVGVDHHPATCEKARALIAEAGLQDRIEIHQADIADWVSQPHHDVEMVLLPGGMMHDFLHREGGEALLLGETRKNLPEGAWFLIQDMNVSGEPEPGFPLSILDGFKFVHDLMGVSLYQRADYEARFREYGWRLRHVTSTGLPNTWIYLLQNPGKASA